VRSSRALLGATRQNASGCPAIVLNTGVATDAAHTLSVGWPIRTTTNRELSTG